MTELRLILSLSKLILDPKKDTKTGLKAKQGEDKYSKLDTTVTDCIELYFTFENMLK